VRRWGKTDERIPLLPFRYRGKFPGLHSLQKKIIADRRFRHRLYLDPGNLQIFITSASPHGEKTIFGFHDMNRLVAPAGKSLNPLAPSDR
jgi:hypothetical protein